MSRWTITAGILAIAIIGDVGQTLHGQGRAGGAAPGPAGRTNASGIIIGRVADANGTSAVPGAIVRLSGGALGSPGLPLASATGPGPRLVQIGASGQFLFTGLPKGSYTIDVTAPGYLPGQYGQERPRSPIPRALDLVRQLDLDDGETKAGVTIHMWRLSAITGTVVDEYGLPIVGLDVHITAVAEIWIGRISSNIDTVTTDDRGVYRAEVAPGDYFVGTGSAMTTMPASVVESYWQAASDPQTSRAAYDQINASGLPMPPASGMRIGGLFVSPGYQSHINPWLWTSVDNGPVFVYPNTYYPSVSLSTMASVISVDAGVERSGIDLQLRPQRAVRISGRLMGLNGPLANIGLRLIGADFNTKTSSPSLFTPVAVTDANGAFTFMGVTPGQYSVDAAKTPAFSRFVSGAPATPAAPEPVLWASQPVSVGDDDISGLVVSLAEGARLSGRFEFTPSTPPLTAEQIRTISVGLRVQPGTVAGRLSGNSILTTDVDDAGGFRTSELVPGPYIVVANRLPPGWSLRSAMTGGQDVADAPIDIGANGLSDLVLTFTNKSTTLTGRVTGDDRPPLPAGQPVPPPTVVIFSTNQSLWPKVALAPRTLRSIPVTPALTYSVTGLPAGDYFVAASSSAADFTDPKVSLFLSKSAARVTLVEGESRTQDVRAVVVPAVR